MARRAWEGFPTCRACSTPCGRCLVSMEGRLNRGMARSLVWQTDSMTLRHAPLLATLVCLCPSSFRLDDFPVRMRPPFSRRGKDKTDIPVNGDARVRYPWRLCALARAPTLWKWDYVLIVALSWPGQTCPLSLGCLGPQTGRFAGTLSAAQLRYRAETRASYPGVCRRAGAEPSSALHLGASRAFDRRRGGLEWPCASNAMSLPIRRKSATESSSPDPLEKRV
jgi:hypothetical protein